MTKRNVRGKQSDRQSDVEMIEDSSIILSGAHRVEEDVQRELLGQPDMRFSSLVVRRIPDGVCLEGVLEVDDVNSATTNVSGLARQVAGVREVLNHLVVRQSATEVPLKG